VALLPSSLDMTDKDFDALRLRLIAIARSVFPDWSDIAVASFGNVLLELYTFVGDVVGYYLDNQARESRLVTATHRNNVIALARMLGFMLHGARAAIAEAVFSLARAASADVRIAAGTVVRTREVTEPVRFQLLADVVIPAGALQATGAIENSKTSYGQKTHPAWRWLNFSSPPSRSRRRILPSERPIGSSRKSRALALPWWFLSRW